ncbi:GntR family transcriptional regulator [Allopusillimonas soli]|uniref:GntR family transcriptional regulator n=1 Tax=Allopusillimonas soli TaxID=659016 RepID=A0A853FE57_9BURK|nr:GntR family transcriptional regulator [Allopusillimonas soli]NYT38179.1 GntR family transcriptional regulator [Allopusillimonas soli]TEA74051.1 GntR family transcriptional regulator [Allopusillimonas soli]
MTGKKAGPAYQKIECYLRELIQTGAGRSEPLPAEPDVAARFGVSRMTARHAYQRLVNAGVIVRKRGVGSFVSGHYLERLPISGTPDFSGWTEGGAVHFVVESYGIVKAPANIVRLMKLKTGEKVTRLQRTRSVNGVMSLDTRYMPASVHGLIPPADIEHKSLLVLLKNAGFDIASGEVELDAHSATPQDARKLGVLPGHPILQRRLVYRDAQGREVLVGTSRYPGGQAYTFGFQFDARTIT